MDRLNLNIKDRFSAVQDMMKPKKDDELFKFAEQGNVEGFNAALPESVKGQGKQPSSPTSPGKRTTIFQKAQEAAVGLLKKDFDVNGQNESGYSLLHVASLNGHLPFVERLLSMGATPNIKDATGNMPLHLATWSGHAQVAQLLITLGSSVSEGNHEGNSPLHFAAQFGKDKRCAQILLANGANVMLRNRANETPLDLAARYGKTELVQLLATPEVIQQIYRKNERPKSSPLHLAARSGHKDICAILLDVGTNVDSLNLEGSTALHEATQFGKRDVVLFLLQAGANPKLTNDVAQTPLELFQSFSAKSQGNVIQSMLAAAMNGVDRAKLSDISATSPLVVADEKPKPRKSKIKARAIIAYAGSAYDPSVLSFEVGDIIYVDDQTASGWWKGTLEKNGASGDFKANYVEIISDRSSEPDDDPEPDAEPVARKPMAAAMQQPQYSPGALKMPAFGTPDVPPSRQKTPENSDQAADSFDIPAVTPTTSVEQWLLSLKLERYLPNFIANGFAQLRDVRRMDAGHLEMIGIQLAGHRKKLLLAIERIPDFGGGGGNPGLSSSYSMSSIASSAYATPPSPKAGGLIRSRSSAIDDLLSDVASSGWPASPVSSAGSQFSSPAATRRPLQPSLPPPIAAAAGAGASPASSAPAPGTPLTPSSSSSGLSLKNLPKPPPAVAMTTSSSGTNLASLAGPAPPSSASAYAAASQQAFAAAAAAPPQVPQSTKPNIPSTARPTPFAQPMAAGKLTPLTPKPTTTSSPKPMLNGGGGGGGGAAASTNGNGNANANGNGMSPPVVPAATKPTAFAPRKLAAKSSDDQSFDDLLNSVEDMMADLEAELGNM